MLVVDGEEQAKGKAKAKGRRHMRRRRRANATARRAHKLFRWSEKADRYVERRAKYPLVSSRYRHQVA